MWVSHVLGPRGQYEWPRRFSENERSCSRGTSKATAADVAASSPRRYRVRAGRPGESW